MRPAPWLAAGLLTAVVSIPGAASSAEDLPSWAYPAYSAGTTPPPYYGTPRRVPDSAAAFTLTQIRNLFFAPDWHPGDHPSMPSRRAGQRAWRTSLRLVSPRRWFGWPGERQHCGPANRLLPPADGEVPKRRARHCGSGTGSLRPSCRATAKAITDEEIEAAAAYFASIRPRAAIRVVEAAEVPVTFVAAGWSSPWRQAAVRRRLVGASWRCPRTLTLSCSATAGPSSWPMCLRAASRRDGHWPPLVRQLARHAMAPI